MLRELFFTFDEIKLCLLICFLADPTTSTSTVRTFPLGIGERPH